jgi:hypothetical protein
MKLRYTQREILYLLAAFGVLAAVAFYAYRTKDSSGMSGVGSLIIILGIVFASRDFHELLAMRMRRLSGLQKEFGFQSMLNDREEATKVVISDEERAKLRSSFTKAFDASFEQAVQATKTRHRFVEAFIVIVGTAVNGFGPQFMTYLMR